MRNAIHHVHLKCADPKGAADWYCAVFGYTILIDAVRPTGDRLIRCGHEGSDGPFVIISNPAPGQALSPACYEPSLGLEHFAVVTEDRDALLHRALDHGAVLLEEPVTLADGTRIVFIRTPQDVRIELMELPA